MNARHIEWTTDSSTENQPLTCVRLAELLKGTVQLHTIDVQTRSRHLLAELVSIPLAWRERLRSVTLHKLPAVPGATAIAWNAHRSLSSLADLLPNVQSVDNFNSQTHRAAERQLWRCGHGR